MLYSYAERECSDEVAFALGNLRDQANSLRAHLDQGYDLDPSRIRYVADVICECADAIGRAVWGPDGELRGDPNSQLAKLFRANGMEIFKSGKSENATSREG